MRTRRVRLADGRHVHLAEWPGRGDPLLLLHGLLGSSASWLSFARATPRWCVAVDLPGFGRSDAPLLPVLAAYAADVAEALEAIGLPAPTVIGHSLGGAVATALAERAPHAVAGLVLCAPAGFGRHPRAELAALPLVRQLAAGALPRVLHSSWLAGIAGTALERCGLPPTVEARQRLAGDIARVRPGARAAVQALARAGRSAGAFHRRHVGYAGPVTALWGDSDSLIPAAHAVALRAALPQATVHIWSGAGHLLHREHAAELARLVERVSQGPGPRPCRDRSHAGPHAAPHAVSPRRPTHARSVPRHARRSGAAPAPAPAPRARPRRRDGVHRSQAPRGRVSRAALLAHTDVLRPNALPHPLDPLQADDALLDWLTDIATQVDPVPPKVPGLARAAFAATRQPAWRPTPTGSRS